MRASIDIHCHIMPGVDDGSPDVNTSMEMLRIAKKNGIERIILTPHHKPMHHNVSPSHNKEYTLKLQELADKENLGIKLYSGNEIYYSDETMRELEEGKISAMADSEYVLVEFHPTNTYKSIHNAIYQVQSAGFFPIIAHVERYSDVLSHPVYVEELAEMGAYIQVNASSIMGKYGFGISHFTKKLLKKRLVNFVATDAHDCHKRAPEISDCRDYVARKFGDDYSDRIFFSNPMSIINKEII
ncbi:MAG: protein-tyrosine-phosphatase [Butyrivibrio sp.]|nr:protein-tyrosine-phosphatase [Butyrivibrio sp.]